MEHIGNDAASPDESREWHSIDWKAVMQFVGKAQMRIAQAETAKEFRRVARLSRSLTRSWQAKALAVRNVTENQGKRTSGIDRELWDTPTKVWTTTISSTGSQGGSDPLPSRVLLHPICHRRVHALGLKVIKPVPGTGDFNLAKRSKGMHPADTA